MSSTATDLPFTHLLHLVLVTGPLILVWAPLRSRVNKVGALKNADTLLNMHNFVVSQVSLLLGAYVLDIGHGIVSARTGLQAEPAMLGYLYHLLKIYESLDILLLVAAGEQKISRYTAFSRIFMPYWSFYRIIKRPSDAIDWRMQALVDCFGRFAVFTIPYLIEDDATEKPLIDLCEEFRWYPEIAMFAFWAWFMAQDQRQSKKALEVFGKPWPEEPVSRLVGLAIVLYASYAKREQDNQDKKDTKKDDQQVAKEVEDQPLQQKQRRSQKKRRQQ